MDQASVTRAEAAPGTVQSVSRALHLLEYVAQSPDGVSAKQVAEHLGVALPSAYHLLRTLIDGGYLVHLTDDHAYVLGYQVRVLEHGLTRQLQTSGTVAASIRSLQLSADAAAYYAIYRDVEIVLAHVADSERRPRVRVLGIGFHEAAHATAFGKVMLAAMPSEQRRLYLARVGLRRWTSRTVTDEPGLETQLAQVRDSGVALEIGEFQSGLSCLAAPVRSRAGGVVGSVAVSLESVEFAARRRGLERAVRQGAMTVTRALNGGN
ncbi:MAG TPA: IclR family transcriptional regulator C-terminal domain-containing protein [Frankiaceae bacterium]|nr:IclR family transcriptional regulator C-terminal domain-containing protein [Frankiaceae bacterium]